MQYLEFEKPLQDIEGKAAELRAMAKTGGGVDMSKEAEALDRKADAALRDLYKTLTPWQKCQVARHPERFSVVGLSRMAIKSVSTPSTSPSNCANSRPSASSPTTPIRFVFMPRDARFRATLPAPPGIAASRVRRMTGTGASGEIRVTLP